MIVVDANVLIHAINTGSAQHRPCADWLDGALLSRGTIALPWICLLAVVRITTNPRAMARPLPVDVALDIVDSWLSRSNVMVPEPTARHAHLLRGLLESVGTGGNLTTDAHIAALALQYGASIATLDRDFQRFGVKIVIPGQSTTQRNALGAPAS